MVTWGDRLRRWFVVLARGLAWVAVVASGCTAVLCLVAIPGVWYLRASLQGQTASGVAQIDRSLARADERLGALNSGLGTIDLAKDTTIGQSIVALTGVLAGVNDTLQAFNRLPFVESPALDTKGIAALAARFNTLAIALSDGSANDSVRAAVAGSRAEIAQSRKQLAQFERTAARWIDRGTLLLTLLCLWFGIAQMSLCRHAWNYARRPG